VLFWLLLWQVWAELLVMLVTGEMDARPHDQDRQRCPGSTTGEQQLWERKLCQGSEHLPDDMICGGDI
jgi:hypothetical protein